MSSYTRNFKKEKKITATDLIKDFKKGEKVVIDPQPFYKEGIPHFRYGGKFGTIVELRGNAYVVELMDGNKSKKLICNPIHIKKA